MDALWKSVHDGLALGDEGVTVQVLGASGRIERIGQPHALVRLTARVPGMLSVWVYGAGEGEAIAGVRAYLFSPDAEQYARREEPALLAWCSSSPCRG